MGAPEAANAAATCTKTARTIALRSLASFRGELNETHGVHCCEGKAYLTYITDTNISAAIQMCAPTDSLEEGVERR